MSSAISARNERIDALRALALLPVFAVNFASFVYGYDTSSIGLTTPQGSWLAIACVWLTSALMQNKGVVLLSFLVGVSLHLSQQASMRRGMSAAAFEQGQTTRLIKQALLGVAHGVLLYFGDILLTYAIAGFVLLKLRHKKTRTLLRLAFILFAIGTALNAMGNVNDIHTLLSGIPATGQEQPEAAISEADTWLEAWQLNFDHWQVGTAGQLFIVPLLALPPLLLGLVAARLRWLTHARWQAKRERLAKRITPLAVVLNIIAATLYTYGIDQRIKSYEYIAMTVMGIAGPLAVAWFVCWSTSLYSTQRILLSQQLLAPLGRYSLSSYLYGSIVMNLLLAGVALALPVDSYVLLALAVAYWGLCLALAHVAQRRGWQGLPERWLSVKAHQAPKLRR